VTDEAIIEEENRNHRSVTVDLSDNSLVVDISDALSEKDKVKFTVHTKVIMLINFQMLLFCDLFYFSRFRYSYVKVTRPGDSEVTVSVLESSCHLLPPV